MNRLETLSANLVAGLRRAPAAKQRAATLAACDFAVSHARVKDPLVEKSLQGLHCGKVIGPQEKKEIEALCAQLDEEYFDMQQASEAGKASRKNYVRLFAKARAVAALAFACNEDPFAAATEAIYEAAATINDPNKGELFAVVKAALK